MDPDRTRIERLQRTIGPALTIRVPPAAHIATRPPSPGGAPTVPRGALHDAPASSALDRRLGRYPVTRTLGQGGMGQVLLVEDPDLNRELAAKVALPGVGGPRMLAKFLVEAQITGQLEHPNIIPVHELGVTDDDRLFFTMKCVRGQDLRERLQAERAARETAPGAPRRLLPWLEVFLKLCDAVGFAHSRQVIHRDLKPANVMVGEHGEVQLMDWGLAKVIGQPDPVAAAVTPDLTGSPLRERLGDAVPAPADEAALRTRDGEVLGTPAFMPPEQARGEIDRLDARSDIYSLGAILYQILTFESPYRGETAFHVILKVAEQTPPPPRQRAPELDIPWELEAVVQRAMARDPAERYPSAAALRADIEAYLAGGLLSAARYSGWQWLRNWAARHRTLTALALALPLVAGAVYGGLRWRAASELRRREAAWTARADAQRARVDTRLQDVDGVTGNRAQRLIAPNGERIVDAVDRWFGAHLQAVEAVDRLLELGRQAPSPRTRSEVATRALSARREQLCLAAADQARALGDHLLARVWIGRAGLASDAERAALAAIDAARRAQLDSALAAADRILSAAGRPGGSLTLQLAQLGRLPVGPALVRRLLNPANLDSPSDARRRLTIAALGQLGDGQTLGPEGHDSVTALVRRLTRIDLVAQLDVAVAIAESLALLGDARAVPPLLATFERAPAGSHFTGRAHAALLQLKAAHPDSIRAGDPSSPDAWNVHGHALLLAGDVVGALRSFDRGIALAPDHPGLLTNRAVAHRRRGNRERALADLDRALAADPGRPAALLNRSALRTALGQHASAEADLDRLLRSEPDHRVALNDRARLRIRRGALEAAQADLERALEQRPDDVDALLVRGTLWERLGRHADALADAERVLALAPSFVGGFLRKARLLRQRGQHATALATLSRGLEHNPGHADLHFARGLERRALKDLDGAERDLTRALELDGGRAKHHSALAGLRLDRGDRAGALRSLQRGLTLDPDCIQGLSVRARLRRLAGDTAAARADLDRVVELAPRVAAGWARRAALRHQTGDPAGALADQRKAFELTPHDPGLALTLGEWLRKRGRVADAVATLDRAVAARDDDHRLFALRGLLHGLLGHHDRVMVDLDRAVALAPDAAQVRAIRADNRRRRGQLTGALEDYDRILRTHPEQPQAHAGRGITLALLRRAGPALAALERAIALGSRDAEVFTQRGRLKGRAGDVAGALADYDRALQLNPMHFGARLHRAGTRSARGQLEPAAADFEELTRRHPRRHEGWFMLGLIRAQHGQLEQARSLIERALELAPEAARPRIRTSLARVRADLGSRDKKDD